MKVAYQGGPGAYSQSALNAYFGDQVEAIGLSTSEKVYSSLNLGVVDAAILPMENSLVGGVDINLDLSFQYNFQFTGEILLKVRHALIGTPGAKLENITHALSHPIALGQCRQFLSERRIDARPWNDTAEAVERVMQENDPTIAAIASLRAAKLHGAHVLATDIQDQKENITRFIVLQKNTIEYSGDKVSLAFQLEHGPGSLLRCLEVFSSYQLNLTKIESRPIPENPFQYTFYVDFLGTLDTMTWMNFLCDLNAHTSACKIFGRYQSGKICDPDIT